MSESLRYILKKWYIILICAVLGAGALFMEKSIISPVTQDTIKQSDIFYTAVIHFTNPIPKTTINSEEKNSEKENWINGINVIEHEVTINYPILMFSNKQKFLNQTEPAFDYEKLSKGWSKKSVTEKFKWIGDHLEANYFAPGTYEVVFKIPATEVKDDEYIREIGDKYLDTYLNYVKECSRLVYDNPDFVVTDRYNLFSNKGNDKATVQSVKKKYIVAGFVLGGVLGTAVLAVLSLRKKSE